MDTEAERSCAVAMCDQDETEGVPCAPVCCNGHHMHWACLVAFLESAKSNNSKRVCPLCRDDYLERLKDIESAEPATEPSRTQHPESDVPSILVEIGVPGWGASEHHSEHNHNGLFNSSRAREARPNSSGFRLPPGFGVNGLGMRFF